MSHSVYYEDISVLYEKLNSFIRKGRNPNRRMWANNTYITRALRQDGEHGNRFVFGIKYHDSEIMTIYKDKIYMDSWGYRTMTTKTRMNWFLPDKVFIYQKLGVWYFCDAHNGYGEDRFEVPFTDGLVYPECFASNAAIHKGDEEVKRIKTIRNKVNNYVRKLTKMIENFDFEGPSSGDCFDCSLRDVNGKPMGDVRHNNDHLMSHLDEKYIVPSLVYNAFSDAGYVNYQTVWFGVYFEARKHRFDVEPHTVCQMKSLARTAARLVRRYFYVRLGIAR